MESLESVGFAWVVDRMGNPIFENARCEILRFLIFYEIEGHPIRQNQKVDFPSDFAPTDFFKNSHF